jgi:hypothetical protein
MNERRDYKAEVMRMALSGKPIPAKFALEAFADERNWEGVYTGGAVATDGSTIPPRHYWACIGPMCPPYELAQHALARMEKAAVPDPAVENHALINALEDRTDSLTMALEALWYQKDHPELDPLTCIQIILLRPKKT